MTIEDLGAGLVIQFSIPLWPTPAVRPSGRTLFLFGGPCLSVASWSAPHPASVPSNNAELGVNGFGAFCRNKRASAAGPKPGITKNLMHPIVEQTHSTWFTYQQFLSENSRWILNKKYRE